MLRNTHIGNCLLLDWISMSNLANLLHSFLTIPFVLRIVNEHDGTPSFPHNDR